MLERRVVITGMGVISPLGHAVDEFWRNLLAGKSGVGAITRFDTANFDTKIAAEVKNFNAENYVDKKEARRMDAFTHYALAAAKLAIADARLLESPIDKDAVGVIVGSGIGGMDTFEREARKLVEKGPGRISPFFIPMMIADIAPGHISMQYGFKGPNYATISACASSSHAIGESFRYVQRGDAEVMICGGAEATITPMGVGGFNAMKALSTRNDDPPAASRPFDLDRDGFVMGEGAGILVLESLENAVRREAKIYAEVVGAGFSADAYHITQPAPGGEGAVRAMRLALKNAGMAPEAVQYVNVHGTSTSANDKNETQAIATVFGAHASKLNLSSTKSMIGHLLGASGAVELIATALTCRDNVIHPTINQMTADPDCFLNYTPNQAVEREVNVAISNSFGFGGHNVCLVVKKFV
ncbi:MAG: 3-oxoacyl-[acyl-carrier-protein] synthase 2 [bacterium]|nr:3-oxoacyl-[acyl-carrier-protein] synthase 2 [bacterium]